ncbi:MAG TPA: DUF3151 domain-containing protein [Pseudonocardiaceae bacterium]|jgi:hypothetical protein|nr:DUF3151 domain-containing protein [Pseudonocardiaceae bacterium]
MSVHGNLLGPNPTLLPERPDAESALAAANDPATAAAAYPECSAAWAALAQRALDEGDAVAGYAFARTGYHRGLDQLRRAGWGGHGPVPWAHRPNQGFLRALGMLARAAAEIGEDPEALRCREFLDECDPAAAEALGLD